MGPIAPTALLAAGGGGFNPLAADGGAVALMLITLLVLFFLLLKFAWTPILNALDAREQKIDDAVTGAQNARDEAEKLLAGYKEKLADAERQVAQRLEEGRVMTERQGQEIMDKAREDASRERERATRDIDLERQRALTDIRNETVRLSRLIAEKALSREINDEDYKRLADDVLQAMK